MQQLLMRIQQQQVVTPESGPNSSSAGSSNDFTERARLLLTQLPPPFNIKAAAASRPESYENAMDAVLLQELSRYNTLITITEKRLQIVQV
ncbi:hypothetical protein, conserved [Eimeria necatrix]|uniref:Dynein heavy chain C-terminal domain-containing protein n=1 Tax=Eimeria necatrix TaxID=51315 RepID=U6MRF8_9EIME|nr:hypothetical protein, conserved [Eimeria necatrix]CDJ65034.1 hypothetical protein, conserved [Eimeria necatrix]